MRIRQRLGQHFLISESVAKKIVLAADITNKDIVLEIGTGKGILIPYLCKKAKKVISIETDKKLFLEVNSKYSKLSNLTILHGDGFKNENNFTVFVSNLPYSRSKDAIEWLIKKNFSRAIVMVQKEFAEKLLKKTNSKSISVLANYAANIDHVMNVNKTNFLPQPKVNSVVLKLTRKKKVDNDLIKNVNKLFSYKRKNIHNILKQFGQFIESNQRLEDLTGDEIIKLAKKIS